MSGVFVTGGTGFVGGAVLQLLADDGRHVKALVRRVGSESSDAEAVPGDVLSPESLRSGMRGCDVVYHIAGLNDMCLRDPGRLFEVNVRGSINVIEASAAAGVRRVVYTSSAAAIGEEQGTVGTETSPHRGWFLSNYERSKYEAEVAVMEAAARRGVDVVAVNPSSVQGPGRSTGSARLLLAHLNRRIGVSVDTRVSIVDVDDCARGHLAAERHGRTGERYILNGATLGAAELVAMLDDLTGIRTPMTRPPGWALSLAGAMGSFAQAVGINSPICKEMAKSLRHGHAYDGSKAERVLGLGYRPLRQTLRRTVSWLVDQGLTTRPLPAMREGRP